MEPEGSSPHSQVPATCPYPEPARSSPYPPKSHFLKIHLNIILPSPGGAYRTDDTVSNTADTEALENRKVSGVLKGHEAIWTRPKRRPGRIVPVWTEPREWRMNSDMRFCRGADLARSYNSKLIRHVWKQSHWKKGFGQCSRLPYWRAGSLKWCYLHDVCQTIGLLAADRLGTAFLIRIQWGAVWVLHGLCYIDTNRQTEWHNRTKDNKCTE